MGHPFDDCRRKIERAKQQISDLEGVWTAFKQTNPYRVVSNINQATREYFFRVQINAEIPVLYNILTGEIIQSMRSTLDYAVCALCPTVGVRTGFPIHRMASETEYKALRTAKVKGLPPKAIDFIDGLKP